MERNDSMKPQEMIAEMETTLGIAASTIEKQ